MLQPFTPRLALASLLLGLTATAQTTPAGRSVALLGKAGESPLIYLAPDTVTTLLLDARIVRESVRVEGRDLFARVDPGDQSITLLPKVALPPTQRLALQFTYREGSPESAELLLTGQPGRVDTVVTVSRPQQTVEACRMELSATRERCEAQSKELAELKARPPAVSPAAVALAGFVDKDGMRAKDFQHACRGARGELRLVQCQGLAGATWSVVVFEVRNTGGEPWAPAWAEVTPAAGGERSRTRAVLTEQAVIPPGGSARVAVEVEMPKRNRKEWLWALHALRVCNADGSRCLSVPKVEL